MIAATPGWVIGALAQGAGTLLACITAASILYLHDLRKENTMYPMTHRRDALGIVAASILAAIAVAGYVLPAVLGGGWWWLLLILAVPATIIAAVGYVESIPRTSRDRNGDRLFFERGQ